MNNNADIIKAADVLYAACKSFRAEKTERNLLAIVMAAQQVEALSYKPALIKKGRSIQVMNNKHLWEVPCPPTS